MVARLANTIIKPISSGPQPSKSEAKFDVHWQSLRGPSLVCEHRFHATRKFRLDRAHLATRIAIELDGGTRNGGRHTRPKGFANDCEKINLAIIGGWKVFRLTTEMISEPHLLPIIEFIRDADRAVTLQGAL